MIIVCLYKEAQGNNPALVLFWCKFTVWVFWDVDIKVTLNSDVKSNMLEPGCTI